jgi:hypothetical protein
LVEITIEQMNWLIANKHLKWIPGRHDKPGKYDELYVIGKGKPAKRKKRKVPPNIAEKLNFMK